MTGTTEGGRKAAETRRQSDAQAFSKLGRMGAQARHAISAQEETQIAKKAAHTRKQHDPDAFKKMGQKGGSARGNEICYVQTRSETWGVETRNREKELVSSVSKDEEEE